MKLLPLALLFAAMLTHQSLAETPQVLLLGDSISIGYKPFLQEELQDIAEVERPLFENGRDENCQGTTHGVERLDAWLTAAGEPDVILFNFGLHDIKRVDAETRKNSQESSDPRQAEPATYRRQLTQIVERLEETGARLFFLTTTPVPPGGVKPHRDLGDPLHYNAIARTIVEPRGIEVIDLYAAARGNLENWQQPVNVHFNEQGSRGLANVIAEQVKPALAGESPPPSTQPWQADPQLVEEKQGEFNYRESKVPDYTLPDPLGESPQPKELNDWPAVRAKTFKLFEDHVYGRVPEAARKPNVEYRVVAEDPSAADGEAIGQKIAVIIEHEGRKYDFPMLLFVPKNVDGPVPAIVQINNRDFPELEDVSQQPIGYRPISMIIRRGYALAMFHTSDVDPDRKDGRADGIRGFYDPSGEYDRRPDAWRAIGAWAWGANVVRSYLDSVPQVNGKRVAVIGHSRGGKTALWTAASYPAFAAAISNESGCGGAALSRRRYGETIGRITSSFPHWFCNKLSSYAGQEDQLPVDQHQLMGLISPRAIVVGSASGDLWADPRGEYLSLVAARPVFQLLGKESIASEKMPALGETRFVGQTGYFVRPGSHNLTEGDWIGYLNFLDERM